MFKKTQKKIFAGGGLCYVEKMNVMRKPGKGGLKNKIAKSWFSIWFFSSNRNSRRVLIFHARFEVILLRYLTECSRRLGTQNPIHHFLPAYGFMRRRVLFRKNNEIWILDDRHKKEFKTGLPFCGLSTIIGPRIVDGLKGSINAIGF